MTCDISFTKEMSVELVQDSMSDLMVLRAARVSITGINSTDESEDYQRKLIWFLMKNRHGSPFEHGTATFRIHAPIFVMRELMRHRTFSFNEESGRYRELEPVFYMPGNDRPLVQVGKAGAYEFEAGTPKQQLIVNAWMTEAYLDAYDAYQTMLSNGIAREVARMVLPVGTYSTVYASCNARALMNFLSLRVKSEDAAYPSFPQLEIEQVARKIEDIWSGLMPVTHQSFDAAGRVCP